MIVHNNDWTTFYHTKIIVFYATFKILLYPVVEDINREKSTQIHFCRHILRNLKPILYDQLAIAPCFVNSPFVCLWHAVCMGAQASEPIA